MRSVLASGLLIALCAPANAARVHHFKPRHVIVRPRQRLPSGSAIPGWAYAQPRSPVYRTYAQPRPPVHYNDTPRYDDPSKFGG
jgi:hypothetical protein